MSDSDDEYGTLDFSEFTEEDFVKLDAALATSPSINAAANPTIVIDIESILHPKRASPVKSPRRISYKGKGREKPPQLFASPFQQYRRKAILSVTDIVSPAWCELQFDYGLRQMRSRPLAHRPTSFVTSEGKEIVVEAKIAAKNDETTRQGRAVHKELEREIRAEELQVDITTEEERWALRFVNLMANVACLLSGGLTRETPVFGIINDHIVVGIVDEVVRKPREWPSKRGSDNTPTSPNKRPRRSLSLSQSLITDVFPALEVQIPDSEPVTENSGNLPHSTTKGKSQPQYTLHIIDTKTRRSKSLPSDDDAISSKLQVMIYHRLLSDLISSTSPFDFRALWKKAKIRPLMPFSTRFLVQSALISPGEEERMICLDDLTSAWPEMIKNLDVSGIDETLQLVYRMQPSPGRPARPVNPLSLEEQEERDLARAIEASLKDMVALTEGAPVGETTEPGGSAVKGPPQGEDHGLADGSEAVVTSSSTIEDPTLLRAIEKALDPIEEVPLLVKDTPLSEEAEGVADADPQSISHYQILGTKEFKMDDALLDRYIPDVLEYWHGRRKPRGVPIELTRRCFSCEYEHGCEWRAEKAKEFADSVN